MGGWVSRQLHKSVSLVPRPLALDVATNPCSQRYFRASTHLSELLKLNWRLLDTNNSHTVLNLLKGSGRGSCLSFTNGRRQKLMSCMIVCETIYRFQLAWLSPANALMQETERWVTWYNLVLLTVQNQGLQILLPLWGRGLGTRLTLTWLWFFLTKIRQTIAMPPASLQPPDQVIWVCEMCRSSQHFREIILCQSELAFEELQMSYESDFSWMSRFMVPSKGKEWLAIEDESSLQEKTDIEWIATSINHAQQHSQIRIDTKYNNKVFIRHPNLQRTASKVKPTVSVVCSHIADTHCCPPF